ncbi:MAG TPA: TPM domain-containing protein [Planctomycetota bacterium]|jgi:uncharacterized protein|nr:TPM domain-containing protein [Planctomycetota bacterium]
MQVLRVLPILAAPLLPPDYPKAVDDHVNDFAKVLDEESASRIREVARALRSEKGIPIVVATVGSLSDWNAAGWSVERYATNLYNEWGVGSKDANQGVLLFVAVKDRKLRIAVGQGFGTTFDSPARAIIDGEIVPRFKRGDHAGGILAGVEGIARALRAGPGKEPSQGGEGESWTPRGTPVGAPLRGSRSGSTLGWIVLAALGVFALGALRSVFRGGSSGWGGFGAPRAGFGGWGGMMMGGLGGFLGSALYDSLRRRGSAGGPSGGGAFGGSSSWGGGTSSFGGGFSSGGGASGSW